MNETINWAAWFNLDGRDLYDQLAARLAQEWHITEAAAKHHLQRSYGAYNKAQALLGPREAETFFADEAEAWAYIQAQETTTEGIALRLKTDSVETFRKFQAAVEQNEGEVWQTCRTAEGYEALCFAPGPLVKHG